MAVLGVFKVAVLGGFVLPGSKQYTPSPTLL